MSSDEFVMWLSGLLDGTTTSNIPKSALTMIKRKLKEVEYESMLPYNIDEMGEMNPIEFNDTSHLWIRDTTCNLPVDEFNIIYTEA